MARASQHPTDHGSRNRRRNKDRPEPTKDSDAILDLLHNVSHQVASSSQLTQLVSHITRMTQHALKASASSLLLLDEKGEQLLFETAAGEAVKPLKRVKLLTKTGIAGWVAIHGEPLLINDVTKDERFDRSIDELTGFVTRSIVCVPLMVQRRVIGVIEVLNRQDGGDFNRQDVEALVSVASTAALSIDNMRLHEGLLESYRGTIKALAATIDAKDPYTRGHSGRVTEYALVGASSLSWSSEELDALEYAGTLHDIGKIGIADEILSKPGALTREEWEIMRTHAAKGANILSGISFLDKPRELILHHHERYDGSGYPERLKGEAIPMGARLLAVADAFDTMTTNRSYRRALGVEYALGELDRCSGTQFCPEAVKAFVSGYKEKWGQGTTASHS